MPGVGLTEVGVLFYNGYTFRGAYHVTVTADIVLDDAGRSVAFLRQMLTVKAIIADDDEVGTAGDLESIRHQLSYVGGVLVFDGQGYGTINTNVKPDVNFGPKPRVISWNPVGSKRACFVTWQVEVCSTRCGEPETGIIAINYDINVSIDARGNTTRTISGYLQLANSVVGHYIRRNPDEMRYLVGGPVPKGFKRTQDYHVDAARARLMFTIRDTETASNNPYPPLISEIDGEHSVRWSRGLSGGKQFNRMSFRMTIQADTSPAASYYAGWAFARQRIDFSKGQSFGVLIEGVSVSEDLFGRLTSLDISWVVFGPLRSLITDNGLWRPVGTNWDVWHANMSAFAHHPYGNAKWALSGNDDVVVDTCASSVVPIINNDVVVYAPGLPSILQQTLQNQTPDPQQSYLDYKLSGIVQYERQTVSQQVLQSPDQPTGTENMLDNNPAIFGDLQSSKISHVIQQSSIGNYRIILAGKARRVGYQVPKPVLRTVGGAPATEVGGYFYPLAERNAAGVPIYTAQWMLVYLIAGAPGAFYPAGNPLEGLAGGGPAATLESSVLQAVQPT